MANAKDQPALNKKGGEETILEATPATEPKAAEEVAEPKTPDEGIPEPEVVEPTPETADESSLKKPSKKGAQARIRELSQKAKKAEAQTQSLADKLKETTAQLEPQAQTPAPTPSADSAQPVIRPGEEIDTVEFEKRMAEREQRILQQTQNMVAFQGQVNKTVSRINQEAREAIDAYPELNPKSDAFNEELSDSVTAATEALVRATPTASVKKFVDKLMKPYKGAVTKEVGEAQENLAKQVSETALRPTPAPKGDKKFSELSIQEMEETLGTVI